MKDRGIQLTDSTNAVESIDLKVQIVRGIDDKIISGLAVGRTLAQNQAVILIANPGEFPFNPKIGVAIDELILDNDYLRFRHRIREHFAKDGMVVKRIELSENKPLQIEANYE